ncbi:D-sedoheptulose 7-phosphate isomerase [Vibrio sp. La 4.2.2]|uniref:D-sedoheptulose-7-phosphate isomerase n=1 Tax=Vibrio sp. La 4.2.2 TaxID=2998830 RepID=UPI0022CDECEE|nr:D-sedoheptulose 7-phosphate isomerase [Vibrio sp. La 4.2.2]MDA0110534.1 D-sedoheptulose 7-phosphate isomerase [Vibrio sp. La 4.2.2]
MESYILKSINDSIETKKLILENKELIESIQKVSALCIEAFKNGNKVILAGNGGSAADAQHIAAEFVSRFEFDRPGLPSIALTTDTSMITAIGNDYGFEKLFERQLEANSKPGDIFIGISTSGNSKNVLKAFHRAKELGVTTVGLCGNQGEILSISDHVLSIPSNKTPRIQESHILVGHIICGIVENEIFG